MTDDQVLDDNVFASNYKPTRPNAERARIAKMFIWFVMAVDIISLYSSYLQYNLLTAFQNNEEVTDQMITSNDNREQIVGFIYMIVYIVAGVTFIQWFRRAYYNLNLRTRCEHTDGWAAAFWFIPILTLFRPYQIMDEMWTKTSSLINSYSLNPKQDSPVVMGLWWGLWIISNFIGQYVLKSAFRSETLESFINGTIGDMILSVLGIPLAILAVSVITSYSAKEEELNALERKSYN